MGIAEKFNKGSKFNFMAELGEGVAPNFMTAKELTEEKATLIVRSFYLNKKAKFPHYVVVCTGEHYDEPIFLDAPSHMSDTFNDMYNDNDAIEQINSEKLGVAGYEYTTKMRTEPCYGLRFIDLV